MNDDPTEPHIPVWENQDPPTEEIEIPAEDSIQTRYNGQPLYRDEVPPTVPVWGMPIQSEPSQNQPPQYDRRRGGVAALVLAALVLGGLLGFLAFSYTAGQQIADLPSNTTTATKTATATATATKTKIKKETVTPKPEVTTKSPESQPTKTVQGETQTRTKIETRTKTVSKVPRSCLKAINAADDYFRLIRSGRSFKRNFELREARQNYNYWREQCKKDR